MHRFLSQKLKFYSFVCIALLLFVHGYNLKVAFLMPFSLVEEKLTFTTFTEYFFANGLLRFRIPMLFAISGYIFSIQDRKPHAQRVKKRFITLIIPYFIWSAIGLLITYLLQQFAFTAEIVTKAGIDQLGDNRSYSQIGWWGTNGILYRWILAPPSFQLWFIRSLFVYNLLYPVIRWAVTKYPAVAFAILIFLWVTLFQVPFFEGQGLLFFSFGIWMQKTSFPISRRPEWFNSYLGWLVFAGICIIKTFMAFEFDTYNPVTMWTLTLLHLLTAAAGLVVVWFSLDAVVEWCMHRRWFVWASSFSFFIYGFHMPLLAYTTAFFFMYGNNFQWYRLGTYLLAPLCILLLCIAAGALLRKLSPRVYKIATGGRGF